MLCLFQAKHNTANNNCTGSWVAVLPGGYAWIEPIYIMADGSIAPSTAPIYSVDNVTYTLTGDITGNVTAGSSAIILQRDNIIVDGAGHRLQGAAAPNSTGIELTGTSNVAIQNMQITAFGCGIWLNSSDNNSISGNNIANNSYGIRLDSSSSNSVYHNNFINNTGQVYSSGSTNVWDNGYPSGGNYWSDYNGTDLHRGPYQNQTGSDGIGDVPYIIDANDADHYPFMKPYNTNSPSVSISPVSATLEAGGKSQLFTATVSSGAPPYNYQWYVNYAPVSGATSNSWAFTPTSAGSYTVYLSVTDSLGVTAASNIATANVKSPPSVSVSPASVVIDIDQYQTFSSVASGGTPPYTYQWCLNGTAVPGATSSGWTFIPNSSGSYAVYLNMTDSLSAIATSNIASVLIPTRYNITFGQAGIGSDYNGTVVTIDGNNYAASDASGVVLLG